MPNIPRLYDVNTSIKFARLRVPLERVAKEIGCGPATLRKMGITPQGIEVETLKQFMATRQHPLKNFPLRRTALKNRPISTPDFREETLEAILGRFCEGLLVPKYGENQAAAEKLLGHFAAGKPDQFVESLDHYCYFSASMSSMNLFLLNFLDLSGLVPDIDFLESKAFDSVSGVEDSIGLSVFLNRLNAVIKSGVVGRDGGYLFAAHLHFRQGNLYGTYKSLENMSMVDPSLCRRFADGFREDCEDSIDYLRLRKLGKDLDGILKCIAGVPYSDLGTLHDSDYAYEFYGDLNSSLKGIYLKSIGLSQNVIWYSANLGVFPLAKKYDAVIAVARQGLQFAHLVAMADVPLYIVEAHDHNGENTFEWLSDVKADQFTGKHILVLEDDVVNGGTLALVMSELTEHFPAAIDLVLTNPKEYSREAEILSLFNRVMFLNDVLPNNDHEEAVRVVQTFIRRQWAYQEKRGDDGSSQQLLSLQDRVKQLESRVDALLENITKEGQLERFEESFYHCLFKIVSAQLEVPAVANAAERGLKNLAVLLQNIEYQIRLDMPNPEAWASILADFPKHFDAEVVREIFQLKTSEYFIRHLKKTDVERNIEATQPHDVFESLKLSRQIMQEKNFEVVLVIGPEGCKYAVPFELAGLPLVEIFIDDSDPARPYQALDDLEAIRGKKVLLLEDDVCSGATLRRTLEHILPREPQSIELFLGNPLFFQTLSNVPSEISRVHTVTPVSDEEQIEIIDWFLRLAGLRS